VDGAINACECTGSDHVEHFVGTVKESQPFSRQESIELKVGDDAFAKQSGLEGFQIDIRSTQFRPNLVDLRRIGQTQIDDALCERLWSEFHARDPEGSGRAADPRHPVRRFVGLLSGGSSRVVHTIRSADWGEALFRVRQGDRVSKW
jgi:hypothetical protein